jgi:CubicO group peptidase (beta-lactamase class C family)
MFFNKDSIIHKFHDGFADIKNRVPATEHTTYHAFSITKTFTAIAILQLSERQKIDIGLPVKNYLPQFSYPAEITVSHLLTHSAGLPNPIPLKWIHLAKDHQTFDRNEFFRQISDRYYKIRFLPNEKFAYSNLGYVFLGQIIEKISGLKYEDYIFENVIRHLPVRKGELDFEIGTDPHAKGYHKNFSFSNVVLGLLLDRAEFMGPAEGKWKPFRDYYINGTAHGGLIGTANSLAAYIQELLKPGCKLLSDEYKRRLFTENSTIGNVATGMCLSWFTGKLNGIQYFSHAGGGGGFYCEIRIYPGAGVGSVVMFNRTGLKDERFLDKTDIHVLRS